ncbi:hypothetical protein [Bacillus thuringiensis]
MPKGIISYAQIQTITGEILSDFGQTDSVNPFILVSTVPLL